MVLVYSHIFLFWYTISKPTYIFSHSNDIHSACDVITVLWDAYYSHAVSPWNDLYIVIQCLNKSLYVSNTFFTFHTINYYWDTWPVYLSSHESLVTKPLL